MGLRNILIVDDDPDFRNMLSGIIKANGYAPIVAASGKSALDEVKAEVLSAALIDLKLEDMSGLEVLREFKENSPDTACILITGYASQESAIEAVNMGAYSYVTKPVDVEQLLVMIRRAIEKQEADKVLQTEREQLLSIFGSINQMIYIADPETHEILYINDTLRMAFKKNFVGGICYKELQGLESPCEFCTNEILLKEKDKPYQWEYHNPILNRDFMIIDRIIKWPDGRDVRFEIAIDITENKRAEEAFKREEEKFRILVEESPLGVSMLEKDGGYKYVNPKFVEMFGYALEEIPTGREWFRKAFPDEKYRNKVISTWINDKKESKACESRPRKFTVTCKDDSKKRVQFIAVMMKTGEEFIIYQDITEKEKLEAQLRQAQKMEAIGTLAGGVAHDFNNLLTTIMGNALLMSKKMDKDNPLQEGLNEINESSQRAAALTRQLLAFSRKQILQTKVLNLNTLIGDLKRLLGRLIGEDVIIDTVLEPDLNRIEADPGQMEQVIMNIMINARDAIPRGGKITIETSNAYLDEADAREHDAEIKSGPYTMLSISDTGCGMDEETKAHIFEPFFTTKKEGKGTGLGLSTVYGIVKQSGGYIWVYSEPGQGTTFRIYLLAVENEARLAQKRTIFVKEDRGSETVLVVEDDSSVRNLTVKALKAFGYIVLEAQNAEEALSVFEQYKGPVHLVLSDVVMPGMSVFGLVDRLRSLSPEIKVLYMSGYTENAIVDRGVLTSGTNLIEKPFTPENLTRKIREVLDEPREDLG